MEKISKILGSEGKYALVLKIAFIGILILFLLYPIAMIEQLVFEREGQSKAAEENIVAMGGGEVTIAGPVLTIPYIVWIKGDKQERIRTVHYARFLPDEYAISGDAKPEPRIRGIYQVILFTSSLNVSGSFDKPDFSSWGIDESAVLWKDAFVSVEMPDLRILTGKVNLAWDGNEKEFVVGGGNLGLFNGEIRAGVSGTEKTGRHAFSYTLSVRGGRSLNFLPFGNETKVTLASDWKSPNFSGAFLPTETPKVTNDGFRSSWYVLSIARNYPSRWKDSEVNANIIHSSVFGVELMIPVDRYLKSSRSVKYAVLFIIIPFIAFFLFEVISKKRIHPLQYLLVGIAICIFYLLLLSLSEHVPFNVAYLLSAAAVTALITLYSGAVLKEWKKSLVMCAVLVSLYAFLFVVLLSEDFALLMGSVGLFCVVASVMYITRKIDWYSIRKNESEEGAAK